MPEAAKSGVSEARLVPPEVRVAERVGESPGEKAANSGGGRCCGVCA